MRDRSPILSAMAAFVLLLALPGGTLLADTVAGVENTGDKLVFHPMVEARTLTLIVSGPCNYRHESTSRERAIFALGEETIDGSYSFSLTATRAIDPEIKEILGKARATRDDATISRLCREGRLPALASTQSGGFVVVKGKIVFDPTPESERKSDRDEETRADPPPAAGGAAASAIATATGSPAADFRTASALTSSPAEEPIASCDRASWSPLPDGRDGSSDGP